MPRSNRQSTAIAIAPRVKICCIASLEEAELAIRYGAHALGFVADMPSGPGIISDSEIRRIAERVPPGVDTFLLTSRTNAVDIAEHVKSCHCTTVQVVQQIPANEQAQLKRLLPGIRRVQVIHVEGTDALDEIAAYESHIHAFLLDSGRPNQRVPELGGTGRTHDWNISAEFVRKSRKPVYLAGGLDPHNIKTAVEKVKPFGIDLCSGVRIAQGRLDEEKLSAYVKNAGDLS